MPLTMANDTQLVRRCLKGDARAFDLLYDRRAADVYRLLYHLAGDRTRAEDVTQETLIAAFRSLCDWQQRGTFRAWLFGIAVRQNRRAVPENPAQTAIQLEDTEEDTAADSDPLEYVTHQQAHHLIQQAIEELPELYREVFVLLRVELIKQYEAARILQLPIGTVQSRLWRGTCILRLRLCELEVVDAEPETPARAGTEL